MRKSIAVMCTMDTKAAEAGFLVERIKNRSHDVIVIDVGPLSRIKCDFSSLDVARVAGEDLDSLVKNNQRDLCMAVMARGAGIILKQLYDEKKLDGVIGIGGNQGSSIAATAMRVLPIGFPKSLVSTVASGNIRPYIGYTDIAVTFSVSDLVGGANPVSRSVLANAAAALVGMAESGEKVENSRPEKTVALTALGNTEASANRIWNGLVSHGYEVITFHASGAGSSAMEDLVEKGVFGAVVDLTPHEIAEEIAGVGAYRPIKPGRLTAAGRLGIPQLVSLGGLEYYCGGARDSLPPSHKKRKILMHNPLNANVKLTRKEMAAAGLLMAERLNEATGPVKILVPLKGWSVYGTKGGPFYDPPSNAGFLKCLYAKLKSGIIVEEVDAHINDEIFSTICINSILSLIKS